MTYIGALLLVAAAVAIYRAYGGFLEEELRTAGAFLCALESYREGVRCYLTSPASWAEGYRDELLASSGFLSGILQGESFSSSYRLARSTLFISKEIDAVLDSCFLRLGEGGLANEVEVLSSAIEKLRDGQEAAARGVTSRKSAAGALLGACAVGVVILAL